jgi:hypothetical protein
VEDNIPELLKNIRIQPQVKAHLQISGYSGFGRKYSTV